LAVSKRAADQRSRTQKDELNNQCPTTSPSSPKSGLAAGAPARGNGILLDIRDSGRTVRLRTTQADKEIRVHGLGHCSTKKRRYGGALHRRRGWRGGARPPVPRGPIRRNWGAGRDLRTSSIAKAPPCSSKGYYKMPAPQGDRRRRTAWGGTKRASLHTGAGTRHHVQAGSGRGSRCFDFKTDSATPVSRIGVFDRGADRGRKAADARRVLLVRVRYKRAKILRLEDFGRGSTYSKAEAQRSISRERKRDWTPRFMIPIRGGPNTQTRRGIVGPGELRGWRVRYLEFNSRREGHPTRPRHCRKAGPRWRRLRFGTGGKKKKERQRHFLRPWLESNSTPLAAQLEGDARRRGG